MVDDCGKLIGLVSDSPVVRDGNPSALPDRLQPDFIRTVVGKMVCVSLDGQPCFTKDGWEAFAEIPVGKEHRVHAARS